MWCVCIQRVCMVLVAAAWAASLAGCSSTHHPRTALHITTITALEPDRFAAGRALLPVSHAPGPGESWLPGDAVLLGIAVDAGGEQREWYLRVRTLGKVVSDFGGSPITISDSVRVRRAGIGDWLRIDYDLVRIGVELFDERAEILSSSESLMPELCLQYGLFEYIEQSLEGRDVFAPGESAAEENAGQLMASEDVRRAVAGWIAIMKLPEFLQRDPGMDQLVWRLIERPGLMSILAHRGLQMEVGLSGKDARPEPRSAWRSPAYRVPVMLTLNGRPAVRCEIVVARGDPPLGPCNGLLAIDATHPSDPTRRIAVRLLGAQRGEQRRAERPAQQK